MKNEEFGLRFVMAEVQLAHPPELLKSLIDVPHSETLPGVVSHSPFPLPLHLHLRGNVLIVLIVLTADKWK